MFAWKNVIGINYDLISKPSFNVFIDIGAAVLKFYVFDNNGNFILQRVEHKPRKSKLIMGGYQITKVLQKKFEMSYEEAEAVKKRENKRLKPEILEKIIHNVVSDWSKSILSTLDFLKTSYPHEKINHVFLCGGSSKLPGIDTTLSELLRFPIEIFNPFNRIDFGPFKNNREYVESVAPHMAIAVGLAARSFENAPLRNFIEA